MAPAFMTPRARILFLDAYDSFSSNIVSQIEQAVDADVFKIYIDHPHFQGANRAAFADYLKTFDAVIAGPGPGSATSERDVGLIQHVWEMQDADLIPVLGVCLGFQSLCLAFNATIEKLVEPRHGLVAEILHNGKSIFSDIDQLMATQYHSLHAHIGHDMQTRRSVRHPSDLWRPTQTCPQLVPLAWDFDNKRNGAVLMAVKHVQKPFWGVQFHPESICTNSEGTALIQNWWHSAQVWNRQRALDQTLKGPSPTGFQRNPTTADSFASLPTPNLSGDYRHPAKSISLDSGMSHPLTPEELASIIARGDGQSLPDLPPDIVHCATTGSGRLTVADVCELFDIPQNEAMVLESGLKSDLLPMGVGTGRYSIVGLVIPGETLRLHYYAAPHILELRNGNDEVHLRFRVTEPWEYIKAIMQHLKPTQTPRGPTFAPFWGGLMGYASYEAGLQTLGIETSAGAQFPDICYAYITRSIVFDHQLKKIYVQSIRGPNDRPWVHGTLEKVYDAVGLKSQSSTPSPTPLPKANPFEEDAILNQYLASCQEVRTSRDEYCEKVAQCQEMIANGHSYELCLTAPFIGVRANRPVISKRARNELSWKLYKRLTRRNPAPFSAYLRMHNVHVLSSSPERYICWDRNQTAQCRPIKGTVRKGPGVTRADAVAILSSSKERAENLMIVDLVRHQLHGVYGSGNVHVRQLMDVEEYETLYQLVSVIDAIPPGMPSARTPDQWEEPENYILAKRDPTYSKESALGFDAFVQSLPPGSMTGAPKKRSCEILLPLENVRRGIYSGVLGYFDVGGGGDFSVVIRTAVKIDAEDFDSPCPKSETDRECPSSTPDTNLDADLDADSPASGQYDRWRIGAGGAVTAQSTPDAEYDEMQAKFQSTSAPFLDKDSETKRDVQANLGLLDPRALGYGGPENMLAFMRAHMAASEAERASIREHD